MRGMLSKGEKIVNLMLKPFIPILMGLVIAVVLFVSSCHLGLPPNVTEERVESIDPLIDYCARGMKAREGLKDNAGEGTGEDDLRRGLIQNPKNYACRFAYGRTLTSAGLVTDARRELKRVMAEADSEERRAEAERFLAIRLPPLDIPFEAQRLNNAGWGYLFRRNDPDAAIPLFEQAIGIEPRFTWAWSNLAEAYLKKKDYAKAIDAARRAVGIAPSYRNGYQNLGYILSEARRYSEATGALERLIEIDPDNVWAEKSLGYAYLRLNTKNIPTESDEYFRKALLHLERALALDPDDRWTQKNLAWAKGIVRYGAGNRSEAERLMKQALEVDPSFSSAWFFLATSYEESGRLQEALSAYDEGLRLDPKADGMRQRRDTLMNRMKTDGKNGHE